MDANPRSFDVWAIRSVLDKKPRMLTVGYFEPLPAQTFTVPQKEYDHNGQEILEKSDYLTCHELYEANVGPSFQQVAIRYPKDQKTAAREPGLG